jgi:DNA-directed RNA polymerase subunit RPC12/RpoP
MSKKTKGEKPAVKLYVCTVCQAKFPGTGKVGRPWSRCPKCR